MLWMPKMDTAFTISGFVVGLIVGVTGVGGGSLMTPLLVLVFGIHPATAVGTDLLYAALTKSAGTLVHARRRSVDWRITGHLAMGSIPSAAMTVLVLSRYDLKSAALSGFMSAVLGVALLLTATALIFKRHLNRYALAHTSAEAKPRSPAATVAVGGILGLLVSLTSVGAGALGAAALFFLYPLLPSIRIVGSDIAHAVPLTLVAGIGHWWLGNVDWVLLGSLLIGSLPGITLGSHLAHRLPERILRPALATMLLVIGGKLIW